VFIYRILVAKIAPMESMTMGTGSSTAQILIVSVTLSVSGAILTLTSTSVPRVAVTTATTTTKISILAHLKFASTASTTIAILLSIVQIPTARRIPPAQLDPAPENHLDRPAMMAIPAPPLMSAMERALVAGLSPMQILMVSVTLSTSAPVLMTVPIPMAMLCPMAVTVIPSMARSIPVRLKFAITM
jgi:hypothetical protein